LFSNQSIGETATILRNILIVFPGNRLTLVILSLFTEKPSVRTVFIRLQVARNAIKN